MTMGRPIHQAFYEPGFFLPSLGSKTLGPFPASRLGRMMAGARAERLVDGQLQFTLNTLAGDRQTVLESHELPSFFSAKVLMAEVADAAQLAAVDHETGDFSQYLSVTDPNAVLAVTAPAAQAGTSFGMSLNFDGTNQQAFGRLSAAFPDGATPAQVPVWRFRIYLDTTGSVGVANLDNWRPIRFRKPGGQDDVRITMRGPSPGPGGFESLRVRIEEDDGTPRNSAVVPIPGGLGPHWIECRVQGASGPQIADGRMDAWVDSPDTAGAPLVSETGVPRYSRVWPTEVRVGRGPEPTGVTGFTQDLDEVVVRQGDGPIGPLLASSPGQAYCESPLASEYFSLTVENTAAELFTAGAFGIGLLT